MTRPTGTLQDLVPLGTAAQAAGQAPLPDTGGDIPPQIRLLRSDDVHDQITRALPDDIKATRFLRVCETALYARPSFLLVPEAELVAALLRCAGLGLEPNSPLRQVFLDPVQQEDGTWGIEMYLGYKGMVQLIHRSPQILSMRVGVVRENDQYDYEQGTDAYLLHRQALEDRGAVKFFYARWELAGAPRPEFEIVTLEEIEERKAFSPSVIRQDPDSAWVTHELMMQMKTVLRIVWPWLPVAPDAAAAVEDDETLVSVVPTGPPAPATPDGSEP